jgi:hypothetical protein
VKPGKKKTDLQVKPGKKNNRFTGKAGKKTRIAGSATQLG